MIRSAIILAAGMGIRMRGLGKRIPKGYICLGTHTILEESISHLVAVGIGRIVIVTGHLAEFFEPLAVKYGGIVRLVHNPLYAESMEGSFAEKYRWNRSCSRLQPGALASSGQPYTPGESCGSLQGMTKFARAAP